MGPVALVLLVVDQDRALVSDPEHEVPVGRDRRVQSDQRGVDALGVQGVDRLRARPGRHRRRRRAPMRRPSRAQATATLDGIAAGRPPWPSRRRRPWRRRAASAGGPRGSALDRDGVRPPAVRYRSTATSPTKMMSKRSPGGAARSRVLLGGRGIGAEAGAVPWTAAPGAGSYTPGSCGRRGRRPCGSTSRKRKASASRHTPNRVHCCTRPPGPVARSMRTSSGSPPGAARSPPPWSSRPPCTGAA